MAAHKFWEDFVSLFSFESPTKFTSAIEVKIDQVALNMKSAKT